MTIKTRVAKLEIKTPPKNKKVHVFFYYPNRGYSTEIWHGTKDCKFYPTADDLCAAQGWDPDSHGIVFEIRRPETEQK